MEKEEVKRSKNEKSGFSLKSYLRDFVLFVDKYLKKYFVIFAIISILVVAITLPMFLKAAKADECVGMCRDEVTLLGEYRGRLGMLAIGIFAGIAPYIYAPVLAFAGYVIGEVSQVAYVIKGLGYAKGILVSVLPLILNLGIISMVAALGVYICKTITIGYKVSNLSHMNSLNYRIKLFEAIGKTEKVKELEAKKENKLNKLNAKKEKLKYLQIFNIAILVAILQFISTFIQELFL